jgi:peptidoglycan hydrolase-like protein with peptidoglycan-binding domain
MKMDVQSKNLLPEKLWETTSFEHIVSQAENLSTPVKQTPPLKGPSSLSGGTKQIEKKNIFQFYRAYVKGQKSSEVEILQKFLQSEKLFSGKVDGIYSQKVISAVFAFQKKYGILSDKSDAGLKGYLGPSTRKKMNEIRNK